MTEFMKNMDEISDVEGFDRIVTRMSGGGDSNYKGAAGEADAADSVTDRAGIDNNDIEVGRTQDDIDGTPNTETEFDVEVEGDMVIDGKTLDSPTIESKNWDTEKWPDFVLEDKFPDEFQDLVDKLVTQASVKDGDLVVVLPKKTLQILEDNGISETIRKKVQEQTDSDPTIVFTSYDEL